MNKICAILNTLIVEIARTLQTKTRKMRKKEQELREVDLEDLNKDDSPADYYDGDAAIIDNISDLTHVAPFYAKMNFIVLCTGGRIQFNINGTPVMLEAHQILLSAPNVILDNYLFSPDFACKILCLSDDIIHSMLGEQVNRWNLSVHNQRTNVIQLPEDDQEQFVYYYELIRFKMNHPKRRYSTLIMQSILRAMLYDVLSLVKQKFIRESEVGASHGKRVFNDFLRLLAAKDVKHSPVSSYATELNISSKYLSMLCTKYSGRPASDWIAQYTKEDIRYHLQNTNLSITEISEKLGFPNISFFGSYVRRQFGMSPSQLKSQKGMPR